ncbi:isocyanide synthase family protein [Acaricomes phytoseiuli]|uniref:isocyanide synthase family protein n=1 Tax=Acaricomes phytoseiuli TaxID=291968 RepID=UPI0003A4DBE5|nr:isocyanide synthase family protein [Acaricomes phytoseiuli]MCW1248606.1 isocyanide synthase family protein [Acaricomes phytoseiuli]
MSDALDTPALADRILSLFLQHRRAPSAEYREDQPEHPEGFPVQRQQIRDWIARSEPVLFVLPGFPCKSPNPAKVLGPLPDAGERESLRFLDELCRQIGEFYPPGAEIVICSDGHIFADVIGVADADIDNYVSCLRRMAEADSLTQLSFFALNELMPDREYDEIRPWVIENFGPDLELLRDKVRSDPDMTSLYRGVVRFMVEDSYDYSGTKSQLQRECRRRGYAVMQRSQAWGEVVDQRFPGAVRLSIHPQRRGAEKLGIRLLEVSSAWTTPWHAIPLRSSDGMFSLVRREELPPGAVTVSRDGRPSHVEYAPA